MTTTECWTLQIRDDCSPDSTPTRVEGFPTLSAASVWTLRVGIDLIPALGSITPDHHDDPREVFDLMTTPEELARFLLRCDYPADEVRAAVLEQYPGCDVIDDVMRDAQIDRDQLEQAIATDLDEEAREQEFSTEGGAS